MPQVTLDYRSLDGSTEAGELLPNGIVTVTPILQGGPEGGEVLTPEPETFDVGDTVPLQGGTYKFEVSDRSDRRWKRWPGFIVTEYRVVPETGGPFSVGDLALVAAPGKRTHPGGWQALRDRATHTGTQPISTVSGLQGALDGKQPANSALTNIGGLTPADDSILQRKAGAWAARTVDQVKDDLGVSDLETDLSTGAWAVVDEDTGLIIFQEKGAVSESVAHPGYLEIDTTDGHLVAPVDPTTKRFPAAVENPLLSRANHTGSQAISTVNGLQSALDGKASLSGATFTGPVVVPAPTAPGHATTKSYVDSQVGGGGGSSVEQAGWIPADNGLLACDVDPMLSSQTTSGLFVGGQYFRRLRMTATSVITNVLVYLHNPGATLANAYFAIYDITGARIGMTADVSTTLQGSSGTKTIPLSSPTGSITAGTSVYVSLLIGSAGTYPSFRGYPSSLHVFGIEGGALRPRWAAAGAGLTSPPSSINPASLSSASSVPLMVGLT